MESPGAFGGASARRRVKSVTPVAYSLPLECMRWRLATPQDQCDAKAQGKERWVRRALGPVDPLGQLPRSVDNELALISA